MSPIEHREVPTDINMIQTLCHTCWDAGKVLYQNNTWHEPLAPDDAYKAQHAAQDHEMDVGTSHNIVIYTFVDNGT